MSYFKVIKEIKQGQIQPVYLLQGTETFFIKNIIQTLIHAVLKDHQENIPTYDLTETPIDDVIQDAVTFPFFGEQKLIIANGAEFLQARPKKLSFEHNLDTLDRYLAQPSPLTVLVIVAPYETIDGRKKITRQLKKHARLVECHPVEERDLQGWIEAFAKNKHLQIEQEAIDVLAVNLSTNLFILHNELSKCADYVGEGGVITKEVVLNLLAHLPINTGLKLVDAVMNRNLSEAMYIYRDLKLMDEKPIALIALLAYQFRIILQVKLLKKQGYNEYQMRQKIKAHPYVIKIANERERYFSYPGLKKIIHELTETDAKIKRGQMIEELAFEQLLYRLIQVAS